MGISHPYKVVGLNSWNQKNSQLKTTHNVLSLQLLVYPEVGTFKKNG